MNDEPPKNVTKLTPEQIKGIEEFNIGGREYTVNDTVEIPSEVVSYWTSIPLDQNVFITLTRGDLDRLYFAITQMNAATTTLTETIRLWSFGDADGANASFRKTTELTRSADGNFRHFFAAVMKGAKING